MRISDWSSDVCSSDLAQHVQVQRAREPVLEAAGRVRGLVLEVEADAGEAVELQPQQVGVGRARGLAAQLFERVDGPVAQGGVAAHGASRSEEHTSELQSLMRISYAVFCLKKKNKTRTPKPSTMS